MVKAGVEATAKVSETDALPTQKILSYFFRSFVNQVKIKIAYLRK